jgi:FkbM family methyltransferase
MSLSRTAAQPGSPGLGVPAGARAFPLRGRAVAAAIDALARWTPYVESEICGLRNLVAPGAVCIDIGAAGGIYTAALSSLAGPAGLVHSVEPLPFANLQVARLLNVGSAANVRRHAVALGAEAGVEVMSVPVGRFGLVTGRSYLDRRAGGPDPNAEFVGQVAVTVHVETLDGLCAREAVQRLDFVKIDVEGAELQVLEGGREVVEAHMPTMLIEIEARHTARYGRTPGEVTAWMFDRGYTMHTWSGGWKPARSIEPGARNYLFRPPSDGQHAPKRRRGHLASIAA